MKNIALLIVGLSLSVTAWSQVPGTLSYQGILVNSSGDPVADGNHLVTFNFYTVPSGGSSLFGRGPFNVTTYKGMFTFVLGTGTPSGNTPLTVTSTDPTYIGNGQFYIELVADGTTLSPRVQLSSVPYAFTAENVNSVNANAINAGTLSDSRLESTVDINSLNVGGQFSVGSDGNIFKIRNVQTSFPTLQGGAGTVLTNDGVGNLSWSGLNAGNISAGTLNDSRLEGTVDVNALNVGTGGAFGVNVNGNVTKINNVTTSFPGAQGSAGTVLTNDGAGNLSWTTVSGGGGGWTLTGNAGTNTNTHFIGTTDNVPLLFRVNNQAGGRIDPISGNLFLGYLSGNLIGSGTNNLGVGAVALASNTNGFDNVAIGTAALDVNVDGFKNSATGTDALGANTNGDLNTANGLSALYSNTQGNENVAIGAEALYSNQMGSQATAVGTRAMYYAYSLGTPFTNYNVAVGYEALRGSTSAGSNNGGYNTAIGYQTLLNNSQGHSNVALGSFALTANTTGFRNLGAGHNTLQANTQGTDNVAVGETAMVGNTTGDHNVAIGVSALTGNTTGDNNTAIGYDADVQGGGLSNATAIGYNSKVSTSNSLVLGGIGGDAVNVGIGKTNPAQQLDVVGNVQFSQALMPNGLAGSSGQVLISQGPALPPIWSNGGWGLTGNSATVDGTNFIGTTDDIPLNFRVNNQKAGRIEQTNSNTFFGFQAGNAYTPGSSSANTAIGSQALYANASGVFNVAVGTSALLSNTGGGGNVAIGTSSLRSNTTGNANTAIGRDALYQNTTGLQNIAVGVGALLQNRGGSNIIAIGPYAMELANSQTGVFNGFNIAIGTSSLRGGSSDPLLNSGTNNVAIGTETLTANLLGSSNTATGHQTLRSNTDGSSNSALGNQALFGNTTGGHNVAVGFRALYGNTTGDANIAIGYEAGYTSTPANANTSGSNNTYVGYNAGPGTSTQLSNATAIGNGATVSTSNKIRLGNSSVTVIEGQVSFTASSDARLKTDIQNLNQGLQFINSLRPVSYKMKSEANARTNWGFIAQDIESLLGTDNAVLTIGGDADRTLGLRYTDFIAPMVKAIQQLNDQNEKMSDELEQMRKELAALRDQINQQSSKSTTHSGGK